MVIFVNIFVFRGFLPFIFNLIRKYYKNEKIQKKTNKIYC